MKIELHLIQNFAPSCLNRDENNMPKDCEFGGVRRARISSQCFKRAVRRFWEDRTDIPRGFRTKRIKGEIVKAIEALKPGQDESTVSAIADLFINAYYAGTDSKKADQTNVLLYIGQTEVDEAAACIVEIWDELETHVRENKDKGAKAKPLTPDKSIQKRLQNVTVSADIALFGRMLAENAGMNTDGSCQVAHAISTHKVDMGMDFYTAVDDLKDKAEEDAGAGMMGVTGFNSACFYRYACIDRDDLARNLGGDMELTDRVIRAFLEAFVLARPTARQNSMTAHNPPSFGLAVVRKEGVPISLANAFVKPVQPGCDPDLVGASIKALGSYYRNMIGFYGDEGIVGAESFSLESDGSLESVGTQSSSMSAWLDAVMNDVKEG